MPACDYCSKACKSNHALEQHKLSMKHYYCDVCERLLGSKTALEQHDSSRHPFFCNKCRKDFTSKSALDNHTADIHSFKCFKCHQTNRNWKELQAHLDASGHRAAPVGDTASQSTPPQPARPEPAYNHQPVSHIYQCNLCPAAFTTDLHLLHHKDSQHTFKCPKCPECLVSYESLKLHEKNNHPLHRCKKCKAQFTKADHLEEHMATAHSFTCPKCPTTFGSLEFLEKHNRADHRAVCHHCHAAFDSMVLLVQHIGLWHKVHCQKCTYTCQTIDGLNVHTADFHHFECATCGGAFDTATALDDHGYSHMLQCPDPECSVEFETMREVFQHHFETHQYQCEVCGGSFDTAEALEAHGSTSHKPGPTHKCLQSECPAYFFTEDERRGHRMLHMLVEAIDSRSKPRTNVSTRAKQSVPQAIESPPVTPRHGH